MIDIIDITELRNNLYKRYSRKEIANKLNVSELTVTRILNNQSPLSIKRYNILYSMLKDV